MHKILTFNQFKQKQMTYPAREKRVWPNVNIWSWTIEAFQKGAGLG